MNQHSFCISLRSLKSILHLQFEHFLLNYTEVVLSSIFSSIHTLVCSLLTNKNKLKIFTLEKKSNSLSLAVSSFQHPIHQSLLIPIYRSGGGENKSGNRSGFSLCLLQLFSQNKRQAFFEKIFLFLSGRIFSFCFFSLFGLSAFPSSIASRERLTCVSTLVFSFSCQGGDFEHFLYFLLQQALLSAAAERIV